MFELVLSNVVVFFFFSNSKRTSEKNISNDGNPSACTALHCIFLVFLLECELN